uniref:Putative endosomal membrane emp70 n=1 Tax=Ixodes ricinus TaxID=34613 RepID=A0A0K8RDP0_IXORI
MVQFGANGAALSSQQIVSQRPCIVNQQTSKQAMNRKLDRKVTHGENEEQLYEHGSKRKDPCHQGAKTRCKNAVRPHCLLGQSNQSHSNYRLRRE